MKRALFRSTLFLLLAEPVLAEGLRKGDLLVASASIGKQSRGFLDLHDARGRYLNTLYAGTENLGDTGPVLAEGPTRLFVEKRGRIRRLNDDGTVGTPFGPDFRYVGGMTIDAAGNVYVAADLPARYFGSALLKLDRNGNVVGQYLDLDPGPFDLDADQCTMYYMRTERRSWGDILESWQVLAQYDVCTSATTSDILSLRGLQKGLYDWVTSLRVVRDGLLMSTLQSIEHRTWDGQLINQYRGAPLDFYELALDPDGETFWAGVGSGMRRFHLATMQQMDESKTATNPEGRRIHAIAVVDGWRAARNAIHEREKLARNREVP